MTGDRNNSAASAPESGAADDENRRDPRQKTAQPTPESGATEVKAIDPVALAAFTTGILMSDFSVVHEAAEWLTGHPVWTHEFPMMSDRLKELALAQFPDMPTAVDGGWEATRDAVRDRYGETVEVKRGSDHREVGPVTTAELALAKEPTQ